MKYRFAVPIVVTLVVLFALIGTWATPNQSSQEEIVSVRGVSVRLAREQPPETFDIAKHMPRLTNEALARTVDSATKRGWKPTTRVATAVHGVRRNHALRPVRLQDDSVITSDGEVSIWDWDDGDWNTAEGTIYIEEYATGEAMAFNIQFYVHDNETYDTIWGEVTYNNPGYYFAGFGGDADPKTGRVLKVRLDTVCCVRNGTVLSAQTERFNANITQLTQNTTEVSAIGGALGAIWTAAKAVRNPAASAIVGALEGVGLSAVGNFIYNMRHAAFVQTSLSSIQDEFVDSLFQSGCTEVVFCPDDEIDPRCVMIQ